MKPGIIVLVLIVLVTAAVWCWHPVCEPLTLDQVRTFKPVPLEQRSEERQWGVQTWQKKDGQWCQCKPWLAREMFF